MTAHPVLLWHGNNFFSTVKYFSSRPATAPADSVLSRSRKEIYPGVDIRKKSSSLILLAAIGLAMDCFTVSLAAGTTISSGKTRAALIIAACFGGFQAIMALPGWLAGTLLAPVVASFDHWAAFIILPLIGGKMIVEGFSGE